MFDHIVAPDSTYETAEDKAKTNKLPILFQTFEDSRCQRIFEAFKVVGIGDSKYWYMIHAFE
jgi:hypothetical protein